MHPEFTSLCHSCLILIRNKQVRIGIREKVPGPDSQHCVDIKLKIEQLLFVEKFNNVLIKFNDKLFVCEPISMIKKSYNRRKVEYHPLMDKLN